jgi:hypothetical protein
MSLETPTLTALLEHQIGTSLSNVHTTEIGIVQSYDPITRTCVAVPVMKRPVLQEEGDYEAQERPALSDVPVIFPAAGPYRITWPLSYGDSVLLVHTMIHAGAFLASGQPGIEPDVTTMHAPGSTWAIPGVVPTLQVTPGALSGITLEKEGGAAISVDDIVSLGASQGGDYVALAAKVDANFDALVQMFASWVVSPQDGGAALKALTTALSFAPVAATLVKAV